MLSERMSEHNPRHQTQPLVRSLRLEAFSNFCTYNLQPSYLLYGSTNSLNVGERQSVKLRSISSLRHCEVEEKRGIY